MAYLSDATHFWEFQVTDASGGATEWQRYKFAVQLDLYEQLKKDNLHSSLMCGAFEFIFDSEHGNHRHRDMITLAECAMRRTPEVVVDDWNVFKEMSDAETSKITKLMFRGKALTRGITDEDVLVLIPRLNMCKSLWSLDLSLNSLTDVSGVALGNALGTGTTLAVVWLDGNNFGWGSGIAIGEAMTTNNSLETLGIDDNNLEEKGGAAIICGLKHNTTLTLLGLRHNNLGNRFGVVIQDDLASNMSLEYLELDDNQLGETTGGVIATWLATNTTLKILRLSYNDLGDPSGVAIAKALTTNTTLQRLSLFGNNFGDLSGDAIATALTTNTTLQELHLSYNNLCDLSGVAIAKALTTNTTLERLSLDSNQLEDLSGVAIAKALTTNTTLQVLYLWKNNLSEESGTAFVNTLAQNSTLVHLDIAFNLRISPATLAKIKFALSPELKGLLTNPSVSPSRVPVCIVGFENVGKTELVNTWYRTATRYFPSFNVEETAAAKPDDERDKTAGISIKSIALPYKREGLWSRTSVNITAWDFAGHGEYFLSHEVMMQACRDAGFIALLRIDRVHPVSSRNAETERLFFWLKFIATACANQQPPPTVFIGGSFRPNSQDYDAKATTAWTDAVLQNAKDIFGDVLNLPQQSIYHMDCRKSKDRQVVELRNALAQAAEDTRTHEDRKVPQICESVRKLMQQVQQHVTVRLASHEKATKTRQSNASATPLSWQDTEYAPIMTRSDFEERVLGKLEVKAFSIGHKTAHNSIITPKSKTLLQIIISYLHDVGDILWFDVDGLRDIVILTPDLFCSKIIGAIFRPNAIGFGIDAVHRGGGLVPKSDIAATFKRVLGISDSHVNDALAVLCQLGLSHQDQTTTTGEALYLFPGALAATSYRLPEWFGPLPPGEHFVVGRRFTLVDPVKTIFNPGCMSQMQVWALGQYEGSLIWRDGVIIPYTATGTLAEAGVQLHRPYSSSQDGDKCAQVSMSCITLVVRGSEEASNHGCSQKDRSKSDCLELLNALREKIRTLSGVELVEESLPPNEVAKSCTNNSNMLDVACRGYAIPPNLDPAIRGVVVGGNFYALDSLSFGSFVDVPHSVQSIPVPLSWTGEDFEPVCTQTPNGGAHLLMEIPRDHADFTRIETNMRRSMSNAVICKIQRVQNRALWNKYFPASSDIAKECEDGSPNEIEAWHSTGTTDPWLICSDWKAGFDVNRSVIEMQYGRDNLGRLTRTFRNIDNKSYGTGVYLAEHFIYSDTLCPPHIRPISQDKQIILAKVTLGNNFDYGAIIPDRRSAIEPEGYHSISGTEGNMQFLLQKKQSFIVQGRWSPALEGLAVDGAVYGRQYVVHRSNQVYPAYLVTYIDRV